MKNLNLFIFLIVVGFLDLANTEDYDGHEDFKQCFYYWYYY